MKFDRRALRCSGLVSALCAAVFFIELGCQSIIGIEDRFYAAGAGGDGNAGGRPGDGGNSGSAQCQSYCADVMASCTGALSMYASFEACLGACAALDPGDPLEPSGNTVACRAHQAELAAATQEPAVHCPRAAPGGGGLCGEPCESYCQLLERACGVTLDDCSEKCAAFSAPGPYSATHLEGDTLWCRLTHVSAAAADPLHCDHVGVLPLSSCVDDPTSAPACEDYCRVVNIACSGDLVVYESSEQCLSACEALDPGSIGDRSENSIGCRKYHAHAALSGPVDHCPHASPTGDDTCGLGSDGVCASYCRLAEAACPSAFAAEFGSAAACSAACELLPTPDRYAVATAESGDSVSCRVLHATRAFMSPDACDAVFGASPCAE